DDAVHRADDGEGLRGAGAADGGDGHPLAAHHDVEGDVGAVRGPQLAIGDVGDADHAVGTVSDTGTAAARGRTCAPEPGASGSTSGDGGTSRTVAGGGAVRTVVPGRRRATGAASAAGGGDVEVFVSVAAVAAVVVDGVAAPGTPGSARGSEAASPRSEERRGGKRC